MPIRSSLIALLAVAAAPALAGEPAALVLDVSGPVEPEIGLYEEVGDGTVLKLGTNSRLTLSHYGICEEVTLSGGTLSVSTDKLGIVGGEVLGRNAVQCPDQVVMAAADLINMSVTLRSSRKSRVMPSSPDFVLAGAWGKKFDRIDVHGADGRVATIPVVGGHGAWPIDTPPLEVGSAYVVVLNGPGAQQHAARIEVTEDTQGLTVLKGR